MSLYPSYHVYPRKDIKMGRYGRRHYMVVLEWVVLSLGGMVSPFSLGS